MPLGGSWTTASMTPVTKRLGKATVTNGQRQFVAGPAEMLEDATNWFREAND